MEKPVDTPSARTFPEVNLEQPRSLMERLEDQFLRHAEFEAQESDYHLVTHSKVRSIRKETDPKQMLI